MQVSPYQNDNATKHTSNILVPKYAYLKPLSPLGLRYSTPPHIHVDTNKASTSHHVFTDGILKAYKHTRSSVLHRQHLGLWRSQYSRTLNLVNHVASRNYTYGIRSFDANGNNIENSSFHNNGLSLENLPSFQYTPPIT